MTLPADVLNFLRANAVYQQNGDWGPDPVQCRWCHCWLYSLSTTTQKPNEIHAGAHKPDCLAVKYLGASTGPRERIRCTCRNIRGRDFHDPGRHERGCAVARIPDHVEPYLKAVPSER